MNLLELVDKRDLKIKELEDLTNKIKEEKRELNTDENNEFEKIQEEIRHFDSEIEKIQQEDKKEQRNNNNNQINNTKKMEKRFSLLKAINEAVENRYSDETLAMVEEGKRSMQAAGQSYKGSLILPLESRAITATGANNGKEVIATEKFSIIEPLRANLVSVQAGAQLITGLVGDVSIPSYGGSSVAWAGETATAANGQGSFSEIKLTPTRLTAILPVSKQFLIQDSLNAEAMLINDISNAISAKLESTIFGVSGSTHGVPNGLFYSYTPAVTGSTSYDKIVSLETAVETGNALMGNLAYVVNPSLKGTLKKTQKGTNLGFIFENGEVNGYKCYSSNHVAKNLNAGTDEYGAIFANWSDLIIGQWGAIDIQVDPYTLAGDGQVRLVVNAYFGIAKRHPESFAVGSLK